MDLYDYITSPSYSDPIMEEIWEIKRKNSEIFSRDPGAYLDAMRHEEEEAAAMGLSYLEYCMRKLEARCPQPAAATCKEPLQVQPVGARVPCARIDETI